VLAKKELPAITSIASVLDKFSNDDISSIPKLSKMILHDQALSSCVLRVANNSQRTSINKVTTVSRAAIMIGIHSIKNICLTSKILEELLQSKNLVPLVYDRLMMLMANAFYAGMLARIMVLNYDESTQEEVYLAAMLYHIGQTSFWSTGSELTKKLIEKSYMPDGEFQKYCASMIGVNFKNLSGGLAKTWNLSDMLIKSLDHPENRATEMKIFSLANQLTSAISSLPKTKA
jgi:HD-like signal output (HDOD) protein